MMNVRANKKLSPTSQKLVAVGMENYRSSKQLEADLERLEKERRNKLRELNQESKLFAGNQIRLNSARGRENSPSRGCMLPPLSPGRENSVHSDHSLSPSQSPRSLSTSPPKSRSPSPRSIFVTKSLSTEEDARNRSPSPTSSPDRQRRLLSKRPPSPRLISRSVSITETTTVVPLSLTDKQIINSPVSAIKKAERLIQNNAGLLDGGNSQIPQIVINDKPIRNQNPKGKDSKSHEKQSNSNDQETKEKLPDTTDGSLAVPLRNQRRNSVPAVLTPPSYLRNIARRESTFVTEDTDLDHKINRGQTRGRSSSICVPYFSHLKDAPRRDSLLRKYIATRGHYKRTAVTLERLISDLARGVHHSELLDGNWKKTGVSLEEWEKLKECRYLRMPSHDEDVVGNTIDVEAIFSQNQDQHVEGDPKVFKDSSS